MGHAIHFLQRLERISDEEQLELAKSLYRDPELLRYVLRRARLPEGAERAAIALGEDDGPRLVVTRDGQFVTCLGEAMRCDLPTIARSHLDALAQQNAVLRERLELARQLAGPGNEKRLLRRLTKGSWLTREEFLAISALLPIYQRNLPAEISWLGSWGEENRAAFIKVTEKPPGRLRDAERKVVRGVWNQMWDCGHLALLSAAGEREVFERSVRKLEAAGEDGDKLRLFHPTLSLSMLGLVLRGVWAVAKEGKDALGAAKRNFLAPPFAGAAQEGALALVGLASRHRSLQPDVERIFARRAQEAKFFEGLAKVVDIHLKEPKVVDSLFAPPRAQLVAMGRDLPQGSPWRFEKPEQVPDKLAFALLANLPIFSGCQLDAKANTDLLLMTIGLSVFGARLDAEDFYLPAALMRPFFSGETEAIEVELAHKAIVNWLDPVAKERAPVRVEHPRSANERCPCGSGRKFKRCCGLRSAG